MPIYTNQHTVVKIPITNGTISSTGNVINGKEVKHILDNQGRFIYKSPAYYTWQGIRQAVRDGLASSYYPLGSIIYDNFDSSTGTGFQVVGYDKHFDQTLYGLGYTHSITLCAYKIFDNIVADAMEAFLYTNQVLPAGTYKFTIPNYDASHGGNKTYYFTSTDTLPTNSQILLNWPNQQSPVDITAFAPDTGITAQENTTPANGWSSLPIAVYVDGTSPTAIDLGTMGGPNAEVGSSSYGSINHASRCRGSNNYAQSGIRQYINSNTVGGAWWIPQTVFDRPYRYKDRDGMLTTLNSSFVNIIATPTIDIKTNSYFEVNSLDGTAFSVNQNYTVQDKVFLLSPTEVGSTSTLDTGIGPLLDYYVDASNNKRVKYNSSNTTTTWWLRTPYKWSCCENRSVATSGSITYAKECVQQGVAIACVIQ